MANFKMIMPRSFCTSLFENLPVKFENALTMENRERTVKLLSSMRDVNQTKVLPNKRAAVLVPLCRVNGEVSLLFTTRSMQLRNNRGQVSFPGGLVDDYDISLENTALRETEEEIGIMRNRVDVWGRGPSIGRTDMIVTPFLGYIGEINPSTLKFNPNEVEKVFAESLKTMCDPRSFRTTLFRSPGGNYVLPVFQTAALKIWGLTALIAHTMLYALLPGTYKNKLDQQLMTSKNLPSMKQRNSAFRSFSPQVS